MGGGGNVDGVWETGDPQYSRPPPQLSSEEFLEYIGSQYQDESARLSCVNQMVFRMFYMHATLTK